MKEVNGHQAPKGGSEGRFAGRKGMFALVVVIALSVFGVLGTIDMFRSADRSLREKEEMKARLDSTAEKAPLADQIEEVRRLRHELDSLLGEAEKLKEKQ